jgi:hypothetical protein
MIFLRIDDGAAKCALRDLRREDETSETEDILLAFSSTPHPKRYMSIQPISPVISPLLI